jgi:hydrogenase nickel incorporation protein HypB
MPAKKPKVAVFKFASCDGCQLSLLDAEDELLVIAGAIEIANFPEASRRVVTNGACHLEAKLVQDALQHLSLDHLDLLIIENVGNLVCPSSYDLGEAMKIVVISTTEGDDKPLKYPAMFRQASVLIINKIDLLPYVPCNVAALRTNAASINPNLVVFETSCTSGAGIEQWCAWLLDRTRRQQ